MKFDNSWSKSKVGMSMLLAASMATPAAVLAEVDFPALVPDSALMSVWTKDFPAMKGNAEKSPIGELWGDEEMSPVRTWAMNQMTEAMSETFEDGSEEGTKFFESIKGGVGFYIEPDPTSGSMENPNFVGVLETDEEGLPFFQDQMAKLGDQYEQVEKDSFEASGVTVYSITGTRTEEGDHGMDTITESVQYAFMDNFFIYGEGESGESIKGLINRLSTSDDTNTISTNERFRQFREELSLDVNDLNLYVNTGKIINELSKTWVSEASPEMAPMIGGLLPKTGLFDFESLFVTSRLLSTGAEIDLSILTPNELSGLVDAVAGADSINLETLSLAPSDALGVSAFALDLGVVYDTIMTLLQEGAPQFAPLANMYIMQYESQTGVQFMNGLIRNIGGEHLIVQSELSDDVKALLGDDAAALQEGFTFFLNFKDGELASNTINGLLEFFKNQPGMGAALTTEEKDGVTIINFDDGSAEVDPVKPRVAFNNQMLIVTNSQIQLQNAIRALNGSLANPITGTEGLQAVLSEVTKEDLISFSYTPIGAIENSLENLKMIMESGIIDGGSEGFTPDMLPDPELIKEYLGDTYNTIKVKPGIIRSEIRYESSPE